MEIEDVVMALIGPVSPVGETNADEWSYENLKRLTSLTESLIYKIGIIADENKDKVEFSMNRSGKFCDGFLKHIKDEYC